MNLGHHRAMNSPSLFSVLLPFVRPYRWRVVLAIVFLLVAAAAALAIPLSLRLVIDQGFGPALQTQSLEKLYPALTLLGVMGALMSLAGGARFWIVSWLGERVVSDMRRVVFARLLQQSPAFFETLKTGEVLSRLTADTTLIQTLVGSSLSMGLRNALILLGVLGIFLFNHTAVTLLVFAVAAVVIFVMGQLMRRVRKLSRASQDRVADVSSLAHELLNAMSTVQANTQETRELQRFSTQVESAFKAGMRRTGWRAVAIVVVMLLFLAVLLYGLSTGARLVIQGQTTIGAMTEIFFYAIMAGGALSVLAEVWGDVQRAAGACERLMELLHAPSSIEDPQHPLSSAEVLALQEAGHQGGLGLSLNALSFTYPSRPDQWVLRDLSFTVHPGERVALVGASGAGKSTVFALLQRFYDAQAGQIALSCSRMQVPIQHLKLHDLRQCFAVVPQEPVIFSSNALENIRYARPEASLEEVIAAAQAAQAHEFIAALPLGYDSELGERGVRLSGGQKQRLAIARAILRNAPILLLDEATSALDAQNETLVQTALEQAMLGRTTLVIAHRLATVRHCDRIMVFEAGQVVQTGTHDQLMNEGGLYAQWVALQQLADQAT
jgi:ATP-binding cassette subfamily B protein